MLQNGGYINPPPEKRQFRDPYGDWWDKQERRNYGEPVHEDEDILGRLAPEEYTHTSPGFAILQLMFFMSSVFGLAGLVSMFYPDKPALPRTFPDGLEDELGGPGALPVSLFSLLCFLLHAFVVFRHHKHPDLTFFIPSNPMSHPYYTNHLPNST